MRADLLIFHGGPHIAGLAHDEVRDATLVRDTFDLDIALGKLAAHITDHYRTTMARFARPITVPATYDTALLENL